MARGWESKSVEEQQNQASQKSLTQEDKDRLTREKAEKMRTIQALKLNIARIREQQERSSNDRYKQLLSSELEHLQKELSKLEA